MKERSFMGTEGKEPRYVISIAASILGIKTHNLRYYEKMGLIQPLRSQGNIRLYSERDIARLRQVKTLMEDMGVNLAGIEVILRMIERMATLQERVEELEAKLGRTRK